MEAFSKFEIRYKNSRDNFLTATVSVSNSTHAVCALFNAVVVREVMVVRDLDMKSGKRYFNHRIDTKFILDDLS